MKRILLLITLLALGGIRANAQGSTSGSTVTGNAQIFTGQQAATGTAAALNGGTGRPLKTICVKALHANGSAVYLGGAGVTTSTGMELEADQSWCANVTDATVVFLVGTGSVSWIGTY